MDALRLENALRTIAVWTSAAAAAIFAGVFYATSHGVVKQIEQSLSGEIANVNLPLFFGVLSAVFVGYLLATKKQFAVAGSVIALVASAGIYGLSTQWNMSPLTGTVLALAAPAMFQLASVALRHAAARDHAAEVSAAPVWVERRSESADEARPREEVAAGAA